MSIWMDPDFQNRVTQLLIYSAEFIETDAECYRESNSADGQLQGMEKQVYESELDKVKAIDQILTDIAADKGAAVVEV